eukprot:SAG11_NODE_24412_length_373_cov_1.737226_1_plen_31_part_10
MFWEATAGRKPKTMGKASSMLEELQLLVEEA